MTIFRADWGFSALVEPADLTVTDATGEARRMEAGFAYTRQPRLAVPR